jgi:hypothetical protein
MLTRFIHSRLSVAAPLLPVLLLVVIYVGFQLLFVRYSQVRIGELFVQDGTVAVNTSGALKITPRPIPVAADADMRAKLEERNAAARHQALKSAARRHGGRFVWMFFVGLGILTAVIGFVAAALIFSRTPEEQSGRYGLRYAITFTLTGVLGLWLCMNPQVQMNLTGAVLQNTIGSAPLGEPRIVNVMAVANALSLAASLALVAACCLLLLPVQLKPSDHDGELLELDSESLLRRNLSPITHRLRHLRIFLYVATLLLVVGVLRMQAVMDWVLAFLEPDDAEALGGLTSTLSSVIGAFYSLVLAAVYLPAAYVLKTRAEAAIDTSGATEEVKGKIRESTVFSQSLNAVLPRLAALLGPLLAGPFAALLERLAGS